MHLDQQNILLQQLFTFRKTSSADKHPFTFPHTSPEKIKVPRSVSAKVPELSLYHEAESNHDFYQPRKRIVDTLIFRRRVEKMMGCFSKHHLFSLVS